MHYATGGKSLLRGGAFLLSCLILLSVLGLFPLNFLYPHEGTYITVVENWGQNYAISRISRLMAEENTIDVVSVTAPTSMIDLSDHIHYWYFGYPAVMVTNICPLPGGEGEAVGTASALLRLTDCGTTRRPASFGGRALSPLWGD